LNLSTTEQAFPPDLLLVGVKGLFFLNPLFLLGSASPSSFLLESNYFCLSSIPFLVIM
jgi:hypothetical protein